MPLFKPYDTNNLKAFVLSKGLTPREVILLYVFGCELGREQLAGPCPVRLPGRCLQ